jgi:3-phenylpropionate/trans-cinnamate dioxygenase ferredoxin reductase subunit
VDERKRLVIVGGGPAGLSAARGYRAAGGRGSVTILAEEEYPPYRRPPLTKEYLRGEIERKELPIEPASWYEENRVELRTSVRVTALDPGSRTLETTAGELGYNACVLATGSEPLRPPIPGADDPGVLLMRTIGDSERLAAGIRPDGHAVVVGSGFIGCEAAASLALRGVEVVMISQEQLPQEERLGPYAGERIADWLEELGVGLYLGAGVEEVEAAGKGYRLRTTERDCITTDTVLLGTGVRARTGLAEAAGLEVRQGGVATDARMRTSNPNVWAVGDVAFAHNTAAGRSLRVEHWGDALVHGETAGRNIAGAETAWDSAPGFWSTIGEKTIKYSAWGDGWDEARPVAGANGGFTVWYGRDGKTVGVLAHLVDEDYERGRELVERGAPLPR